MSDAEAWDREIERRIAAHKAGKAETFALEDVLAQARLLTSSDVEIAMERDREIESGSVQPLTHEEFRQRTRGAGSLK
jgi:hypothetical protein